MDVRKLSHQPHLSADTSLCVLSEHATCTFRPALLHRTTQPDVLSHRVSTGSPVVGLSVVKDRLWCLSPQALYLGTPSPYPMELARANSRVMWHSGICMLAGGPL